MYFALTCLIFAGQVTLLMKWQTPNFKILDWLEFQLKGYEIIKTDSRCCNTHHHVKISLFMYGLDLTETTSTWMVSDFTNYFKISLLLLQSWRLKVWWDILTIITVVIQLLTKYVKLFKYTIKKIIWQLWYIQMPLVTVDLKDGCMIFGCSHDDWLLCHTQNLYIITHPTAKQLHCWWYCK